MIIIYHLIAILGICMVYESILPLFRTNTWQSRMEYWANTSPAHVQQFALAIISIGTALLIISAIIWKTL